MPVVSPAADALPSEPTGPEFEAFLSPLEIRAILGGQLESLGALVASTRLHATDPKGDTPLHLAARLGNLSLCDLLVGAGSKLCALNHAGQTPAEVASAEGHRLAAELLSALNGGTSVAIEIPSVEEFGEPSPTSQAQIVLPGPPEQTSGTMRGEYSDDPTDFLCFEAEAEPGEFLDESATKSGTFVVQKASAQVGDLEDEGDWEFDLSAHQVLGEGIRSVKPDESDSSEDYDFLKVRSRGRQSTKRTRLQAGTRLGIETSSCRAWAEELLEYRWIARDDIESIVALCRGNGDPDELRVNLQRHLEAAGLAVAGEGIPEGEYELWEPGSDVSSEDLAEAAEAALTRSTPLPGTQRFSINKSKDVRLLEAMVRARQELQIGVLGCNVAIEKILETVEGVRSGMVSPGAATLKSITPSRPDQAETVDFFAAAEALKQWNDNGRVMDGKRRREALEALDALELPLTLLKKIVTSLRETVASGDDVSRLDGLISSNDAATDKLILEHLSYARRFASRNVEGTEDPEDVFQVAFTGLQRSTRRFDPGRGERFSTYCTFWMMQALARWRADEGLAIRIPVHRFEEIAKLDRTSEGLGPRAEGAGWEAEVAAELGWTRDKVSMLRQIPREAEYPETLDEWDALIPEPESEDIFQAMDMQRVVADALSEMPEQQANVIRMRFGIGRAEEMTLEEIGKFYDVTRERIRQIESKALKYLGRKGREGLQELKQA